MRVDVAPLRGAEVGETLDYSVAAASPELADLTGLANLTAAGTVTKLEDRLLVTGSVEAALPLTCARCLKEFDQALAAVYREEFAPNPTDEQFAYQGNRLSLAPMLRTVLLLAVPLRPLHQPDCRGLCPVCGQDRNDAQWPHEHPSPDSDSDNPFSQLKGLPK